MKQRHLEEEPVSIPVPPEAAQMSPKQIILLMRLLGVGKKNYSPPHHARSWTSAEFLKACSRDDVISRARGLPPERSTVEGWFSENGPIPNDNRSAFHYFFHIFFAESHHPFGTKEWKEAYFASIDRMKIDSVLERKRRNAGIPLRALGDAPIRQITRPGPEGPRVPLDMSVAQHLLARDDTSRLGTVLLLNCARRCFLALPPQMILREPDWRAFADLVIQSTLLPEHLLTPDSHLLVSALATTLDVPPEEITSEYCRSFHVELDADLGGYLGFFRKHGAPDYVLNALTSRCELERLKGVLGAVVTDTPNALRSGDRYQSFP